MKILSVSHAAASSAEYLAGIPGDWPRIEMVVDDKYVLSQEQINAGYVLRTKAEHAEIKTTLQEAFDQWTINQKTLAETKLTTEKVVVAQEIDQIEMLLKVWEGADEKAKADIILKMFILFIQAFRSIGVDMPDIGKK